MANKDELEKALVQLRRIEEHRTAEAEKEIRRLYKSTLKDLKQFIAYEYAEYAEDGKLTYEILQKHGRHARFLEEVEQRMSGLSPEMSKEIKGLVEESYKLSYEGMIEAVKKSENSEELAEALVGLRGTTPESIQAIVEKGLVDDVLKKNWQAHVYEIKRNIAIGLAVGDRLDTVAKRISKAVDTDYKKALVIARTESSRAREAGFCNSAIDINDTLRQGVTQVRMTKRWVTMRDERVRPNIRRKTKKGWKTYKGTGANHQIMDGVLIEADEMFILSDGHETLAPKQSGIAGQDINCRCKAVYRLMSDQEFYNATGRHFKGLD